MDRFYQITPTIPFGTTQINPFGQTVPLENALLVSVELLIPPGHNGFTGIRIRSSRQQILPWGNNDWFIGDNYTNTFPVDSEIGASSISIQAYNEDVYDHTFYVRFHIRSLPTNGQDVVPPGALIIADAVINGELNGILLPDM